MAHLAQEKAKIFFMNSMPVIKYTKFLYILTGKYLPLIKIHLILLQIQYVTLNVL